jgi:hypothetical protein
MGVSPVNEWYAARDGKSLIHFGASAGVVPVRMAVMHDMGTDAPRDAALNRMASTEERKAIEDTVRKALDEGALGVGLVAELAPLDDHRGNAGLFRTRGQLETPHIRSSA